MPVAAQVLRHATERPHQPALCGPEGSLTYAQLWERVSTRRLGDKGLIAITLTDPVEQLVTVLAADLAGATPLLCERDQFARVTAAVPVGLHVDAPLPTTPDPAPRRARGRTTWRGRASPRAAPAGRARSCAPATRGRAPSPI